MKRHLLPLVTIAALAAPLGALAATELVGNGSFEANAQAAGSWSIYPALNSWTGGAGGIELRNNVAGTARDGSNFVELDTTRNSTMSQDLAGNNTGWVTLSFWYSAREYTRAGSNGLQLSFGGQTIDLLGTDNLGPGHQWLQYTGSFLLSGFNDTLTFAALGTSDSYGTSLDKISVMAVPEPASTAMLLAGLGVLGVVSRRRRPQR